MMTDTVSVPRIDYQEITREQTTGIIRRALGVVQGHGMPQDHKMLITFSTSHSGVELPSSLAADHPGEMTVVLEDQFWGLKVNDRGFSVVLNFGGSREHVRIPFDSVSEFRDGDYFISLAVVDRRDAPHAAASREFPDNVIPFRPRRS